MYLKELSKKNPQHPLIAKELPQIKEIKEKFDYFQKKIESLKEEREDALKKDVSDRQIISSYQSWICKG